MRSKEPERRDQMQRSRLVVRLSSGRSLPIAFLTRVRHASDANLTEALDAAKLRGIEFAQLPNGTLIDLLRHSSGELMLAVFQDGMTSLQRKLQHEDITFFPLAVNSGLTRYIRFPTSVGASHSARELLREIEGVLHLYYDCDTLSRKLLAHFGLYSWIADLLPVAPYIWVVGPYGYGKTTLLQIMSAICRRSILVGDVSMPGLYSAITEYHPTVLLDEFEPGKDSKSRHFLRLLRVGSRMGERVLRAARAYDVFGPKIIASREGPGDAALASRGFYIVARPFSRDVSGLTPRALEAIAEQLQPKLAAFRLNNYAQLKSVSASFTLSAGLSPRLQDMMRALALPISGDAELGAQLLTILEAHDQQARVSRDGEPEWFVALALLDLAHTRGPGAHVHWTAKLISAVAQSSAERRGESFNPKPRKVGDILRSLGLNTQQLGSLGRGLESSSKLKDQIHEIGKSLGICAGDLLNPEFPHALLSCARCEKYGLDFDNMGRKLRYEPFSVGSEDPENPTSTDE